MSLIIAEVTDGAVYMGADTQSTIGETQKTFAVHEESLKINKLPNGILIGHAGKAQNSQLLANHPEWFEALPNGTLTKEFIVMEIVPAFYRELKKRGWLKSDSPANSDCSILLAQGDKLFRIDRSFAVFASGECDAIGCGSDAYFVNRVLSGTSPVRERLITSLRLAEAYDTAIGAPFVFIDTKNMTFEFVEE